MRRTLIVLSLVLTFLAAGTAAAVEIDGLPTMAWGRDVPSVLWAEQAEINGPELMPLGVIRSFGGREVLGHSAEVSMLFYEYHLVGWLAEFPVEDGASGASAARLSEELSDVLARELASAPVVEQWNDGEYAFSAARWETPDVSLELQRVRAGDVQRVVLTAARPRARRTVDAANVHLFLTALETEEWMPPLEWGLPKDEVIDDDPRWEPGFLGHEGVTSFETVRRVLGRPAFTMVIFVDDQLAAWVSSLAVHGDAAAKDECVVEVRRLFEGEHGEPTTETETGLFWESEQEKLMLLPSFGEELSRVGIGAYAKESSEEFFWAISMHRIGVAAPGMPRPAKGE